MFLFDIDGVITDPITSQVEPKVMGLIAHTLERGEPVAFNTGRGMSWMQNDILPALRQQLSRHHDLHRLCIACQKGAFRVNFNRRGEQEIPVVEAQIALIPSILREEVNRLVTSHYAETMFPGEIKDAVLSPQMKFGADYLRFKAAQSSLVEQIRALLRKHKLDKQFKIDPTRIATDIEDRRLGKALGARRILAWLAEQGIQKDHFVTFGDSKSDLDMAKEIHSAGLGVEFVFVGEEEQLSAIPLPFPVHLTRTNYTKGTLEYLYKS